MLFLVTQDTVITARTTVGLRCPPDISRPGDELLRLEVVSVELHALGGFADEGEVVGGGGRELGASGRVGGRGVILA